MLHACGRKSKSVDPRVHAIEPLKDSSEHAFFLWSDLGRDEDTRFVFGVKLGDRCEPHSDKFLSDGMPIA